MKNEKGNILEIVRQYILQYNIFPEPSQLISSGRRIIVGLSGGSDSVALLHILHSLGYPLYVTHVNFMLRGEESERDEKFACDYATRLGFECNVQRYDTRRFMHDKGISSLEMACRSLRYSWWELLLDRDPSLVCTAVGHHKDDAIETTLINIMRGTGLRGVASIRPFNESLRIARPLLCLSREEILDYCDEHHLDFITDSSNRECICLRNNIRLRLLPLMEELLPQARKGIATTIENMLDVESFVDWEVKKDIQYAERVVHFENVVWRTFSPDFLKDVKTDFILRLWRQQMEEEGYTVSRHRNSYIANVYCPILSTPEEGQFIESRGSIGEIRISDTPHPEGFELLISKRIAIIADEASLKLPLKFRHWQKGDTMKPYGLGGHSKLVSDLFTDAHIPNILKKTLWIVTDADGEIIWIPYVASAFPNNYETLRKIHHGNNHLHIIRHNGDQSYF